MLDQPITELASRQYGLFSRQQALDSGVTERIIHRRLHAARVAPGRSGGLQPLPGVPDSWRRSLWLAHLDIGPVSVVSHEAAAALHRLILFPPGPVTLTVVHGDHERTSRRWRAHQSRDLRPVHVTNLDDLPVTTVPRTFVDLAAVSHEERLARSLEDAHVSSTCRLEEVQALYDEVRRPGKPGMKRLGQVLASRGPGYVPPESVLERRLLKVLEDARIPAPVRQFLLPWRDRVIERVDLAFPGHRILVEADGRRWHARMDQMASDRRRDREALNHGWRPYRFVWEEIMRRPDLVRHTMVEALARAA